MPCRTDWYCEDCESYHCNDYNHCPNTQDLNLKTKKVSNKKELPINNDMFFEAFSIVENNNLLPHLSDEVKNWYNHQKNIIAYNTASNLTLKQKLALNIDFEVLKSKLLDGDSFTKYKHLSVNMLCEVCTVLHNFELLSKLNPETIHWYNNHCLYEKYRIAYEAAEKLTIKERQALGINMLELKDKAASLTLELLDEGFNLINKF